MSDDCQRRYVVPDLDLGPGRCGKGISKPWRCKLGFHREVLVGTQHATGYEYPFRRDVYRCTLCGKERYWSYILGAENVVNDNSLDWLPKL